MSKITILGGDFEPCAGLVRTVPKFGNPRAGRQIVNIGNAKGFWLDDFVHVEKLDQQSAKRLAGTLGWGFVGTVALGPLGMLAGLMVGGQSNTVAIAGELRDGRKLVATVTADDFHKHIFPATVEPIRTPKRDTGRIMWSDLALCAALLAIIGFAMFKGM